MGEYVGDPNLRVESANWQGTGKLVMTDVAVRQWVQAYRKYATTMEIIAEQIEKRDHNTYFGDLDSLRQLAAGYDRLLYGGDGSLHQRVLEFAAAAHEFADKLLAQWQDILAEDGQTAASIAVLGTPP